MNHRIELTIQYTAIVVATASLLVTARNWLIKYSTNQIMVTREHSLLPARGARVPVIYAYDLAGKRRPIAFPSAGDLLLIFSPSCRVCSDNWINWRLLEMKAHECGVEVTYLNLTRRTPVEFTMSHHMRRIFEDPDPRAIVGLKLALTPETLLVDGRRRIIGAWLGLLDRDDLRQVSDRLLETTRAIQGRSR